jgi:8-oxo-dGTP pyrophosphatase MutT (NUDIX family)
MQRLVSAGGVVYRKDRGQLEVILCGRNKPAMWALPKGTPTSGETLEQTALREVREETGLKVNIIAPIGSINYWFSRGEDTVKYNKTVYFYLMSTWGGTTTDHDPEFDTVCWFPIDKAIPSLTYHDETRIMKRASTILANSSIADD